jgi:hypothetical protein
LISILFLLFGPHFGSRPIQRFSSGLDYLSTNWRDEFGKFLKIKMEIQMKAYFEVSQLASALGGEVIGPYELRVPGPGRPKEDRSLLVMLDPKMPDQPFLFSFADDESSLCESLVRSALSNLSGNKKKKT